MMQVHWEGAFALATVVAGAIAAGVLLGVEHPLVGILSGLAVGLATRFGALGKRGEQ